MSHDPPSKPSATNRRAFLKRTGVGLLAVGGALTLKNELSAQDTEKTKTKKTGPSKTAVLGHYRTLGRTGRQVSKIGVGTASLTSPQVLDRAIDLGLNYLDTAHCYMNGKSEITLGKVLRRRRKEVFLTTKWHPGPKTSSEAMLRDLDESLKRLQCSSVDCIMVHSVGDLDRLRNPEVLKAFNIAKKAGKVKHLGMSSHSPNMIEVVREAMKMNVFDIVLIKYSYMSYPGVGKLIDDLYEKKIGVTVMKTRDGARHTNVKKFTRDDGFVASALRWASSNPKIASTVISAETFEDIELHAKVAGELVSQRDIEMLDEYKDMFTSIQCRGCGDCGPSCPSSVPVWEVDRAAMYYDRYREEHRGMNLYAALGQPASACVQCDAPCESACSYGISIREQMLEAHAMMGLPLGGHFDLG